MLYLIELYTGRSFRDVWLDSGHGPLMRTLDRASHPRSKSPHRYELHLSAVSHLCSHSDDSAHFLLSE